MLVSHSTINSRQLSPRYLFGCTPLYPSIHPSILPSICPSICPFIKPQTTKPGLHRIPSSFHYTIQFIPPSISLFCMGCIIPHFHITTSQLPLYYLCITIHCHYHCDHHPSPSPLWPPSIIITTVITIHRHHHCDYHPSSSSSL